MCPAYLLVCHAEWWGITDEVKRQASYLQQQTDFQVFIPDLYHGKIGVNAEEASHVSLAIVYCCCEP